MNLVNVSMPGVDISPVKEHSTIDSSKDTPPVHATITSWLTCGVEHAADQPAVDFRGTVVNHRELDELSNRIAHYLIQQGVRQGDCVGMCLERSIEMIGVMIGILKAGAAYVPLDPSYPPDRLSMMEEDARLRCLVVHSTHAELFKHRNDDLHIWNDIESTVANESPGPTGLEISPENIAYVIFTSGSTGRPKGVAMPHRALSNLIEWQLERTTFKPMARVLQYSSVSFDVSFQEIATTIASGGTLYLISNDHRRDPRKMLKQLAEQRIERLFLPYVAMRSLIEAALVVNVYPDSLKEIITAGEQLRVDNTVRSFFKNIEESSLDNQYGPSETHVITAHLLEGDPDEWPELPPIGVPLKNTGTYILDENMQPVTKGETGELYLAGRNLAHGYIHRDDLTNKVFIESPFDHSNRPILYRTGDLASYNKEGSIDLLGRIDHQIKIRGHRIEPGEVNSATEGFSNIGQCLTHAVTGINNTAQLATYFTVKEGLSIDPEDLRQYLTAKLPEYMVPTFLIELDSIPYTPSGKVDLKSLPRPSIGNSQYANEEIHYESATETALANIWSEVLGLEGIPRTANFFDLGGDSLGAVTLFLNIQQEFDQDLPLASLTQAPTIATLAQLIDGNSDVLDLSGYRSLQLIQRGEDGVPPLFLIHGGAGNVLIFNNFAKNLDRRQPVYGFQWAGWDGNRGHQTICEMAAAYKEELLRFQRLDAYRLGGHCIGGLIAIELARQLREDGIEIDGPLIVVDSPNLESVKYYPREPENSEATCKAFMRMADDLASRNSGDSSDWKSPVFGKPEAWLPRLLKGVPVFLALVRWAKIFPLKLKIYITFWCGQKVPVGQRPSYSITTQAVAIRQYCSTQYPGDVVYFRSGDAFGRDMGLPGWWDDPFLGFEELVNGHFQGHVVGSDHVEVLGLPELASIAQRELNSLD